MNVVSSKSGLPWDELGVNAKGDTTAVLKRAGLAWDVIKTPLFFETDDKKVVIAGKEALMRSDGGLLSVVSRGWEPTQNIDALNMFHEAAISLGAELSHIGSMRGGRIVWAIGQTPKHFDVEGDRVDMNVLLTNPHEYGRSVEARYLALIDGESTFALALEHGAIRMTHRSSARERSIVSLVEAQQELMAYHDWFRDKARAAAAVPFAMGSDYFHRVFGSIKPAQIAETVLASIRPEKDLSRWQAFRAVATTIDTKLGRTADTRLASAWYGINKKRKERALRLAALVDTRTS